MMVVKQKNTGSLNFILFLILALVWSGSFINIKIVVNVLPPVFSAMMRVLISLICLSVFFIARRKKIFLYSWSVWRIWIAGLFSQFIPFALLFYGEQFIEPALASIINSTVSLWSLLLGALIYKDMSHMTMLKISGLVLGFAGITTIFLPLVHQGESSMIGILAIMGMSISYAIGGIISQHAIFNKMQVGFETNLLQQHVSSILFLIMTSLSLETWPAWGSLLEPSIISAFLYLGVIATAFAWVLYFYLIREWGAMRAASVMYIVPMLAILWDFLFLGYVPGNNVLIGTATILIGVTFIQWKRKPKEPRVELHAEC